MKKVVALSIVSMFALTNADLYAASKKKSRNQAKSSKKVTQKLKKKQSGVSEAALDSSKNKSKFGLKYLADISTSRNANAGEQANDINGYSLTQQITGSYNVTSKDILSLTARVDTAKSRNDITNPDTTNEKTEDNIFNRVYLRYMRTSVLNEKQHGIDVTPFIDLRYYSDAAARGSSDGLVRPALSFSKTFGRLSTNVTFLRAQYFSRSDKLDDSSASDYYNYITFGPSYEITDKLSVSMLGEYIKVIQKDGTTSTETTDIAVSAAYKISPAITGEVYVDSNRTMVPGDAGDLFRKGLLDDVNFGAAFTFKIL